LPTEPSKQPQYKADKSQSIQQIRKQLDEVTKQREQSEKTAAEYFGRLQRLQADLENLQKITQRQIDSVTKQASEKLVIKLLPILDALQQAGGMAHTSNTMPSDEIAVGLKMLHQQLTEILSGEGLEEIPTIGKPLDPGRHEVVGYMETDEEPENIVVEEVRKGYSLNNKVIRPSLVIVSKRKGSEEKPVENTTPNLVP